MPTSIDQPEPRIYGYARASRNHQVKSPEMQRDMILEKAKTIEARWVRCRTDAATSATETRWDDPKRRPEFGKLMRELEPGDHLILWRMDRLERNPFGMVKALEWLVNRGVSIHILEHGGMQLDLDKPLGRLLVMILAGFAGFFADQLSEAVKTAIAWRKEHGLAYGHSPPPGKVRRHHRVEGQSKPMIEDLWDQKQCDLIREIKHRFDRGERMVAIAEDFGERKEKRWNGKLWYARYGKKKRLNLEPFYRAYWFYTELLASGKDLMDVPVGPEQQERAKRQLRAKRAAEPKNKGESNAIPI